MKEEKWKPACKLSSEGIRKKEKVEKFVLLWSFVHLHRSKVWMTEFFEIHSRTTKVVKSLEYSIGGFSSEFFREFSPESRLGECGTRTLTDGIGAWLVMMLLFDVSTTFFVCWQTNVNQGFFCQKKNDKMKKETS